MEAYNSYNDDLGNDWNVVVQGESLKGEEIGGFEVKAVEQTTGVKDTGHPERFEQRKQAELAGKALVALIANEPKALDKPGFWMNESDVERNREAIDATRERLRTETSEEFEAEAKALIEHVETGVAKNGVEATYDMLKDKNEALVVIYRETWESLKDEPAWKKAAGEITDEEKAQLGKAGIEAFMKKYPTAADFRQAQREFFGHIKGDSGNQRMIQENIETYIDAMLGLGEALYGEQEQDRRALEGVRRQAKREAMEPSVEGPEAEETAEPKNETEPKAEEVAEPSVEEPEAEESAEPKNETEPKAEEVRREVEKMAEEAKAASEALKAKAEAEKKAKAEVAEKTKEAKSEAKETKPEGELAVSEKAERKKDEQYQRFARIANQRLLGFNRWRKKAEKAEKSKAKKEKAEKVEKPKDEPKVEKKAEKKTETKVAKVEEIRTMAEDKEFLQEFEKDFDKRYGTGYYLDGKKNEGMRLIDVIKQGLFATKKVTGELFGKKQELRISDPYEIEGRKAMAVYGYEKGESGKADEKVIRTVIQNLKDGKFYLLEKYKMKKNEIVDGKIDEGGVDWDATGEMLVSIRDEQLQRALAEIAKGRLTVPNDALRAALGLAEKQVSMTRG